MYTDHHEIWPAGRHFLTTFLFHRSTATKRKLDSISNFQRLNTHNSTLINYGGNMARKTEPMFLHFKFHQLSSTTDNRNDNNSIKEIQSSSHHSSHKTRRCHIAPRALRPVLLYKQ